MQMYQVVDKQGGTWSHLKPHRREADQSLEYMLKSDHWRSYISTLELQIAEVEVTTLPSQTVAVYGDHIGFQFSRTRNGRRTLHRTVRDLRRLPDGKVVGTIFVEGRPAVPVINLLLDVWFSIDPKALPDGY